MTLSERLSQMFAAVVAVGWLCAVVDAKVRSRQMWHAYDDPDDTSFAAYVADQKRAR